MVSLRVVRCARMHGEEGPALQKLARRPRSHEEEGWKAFGGVCDAPHVRLSPINSHVQNSQQHKHDTKHGSAASHPAQREGNVANMLFKVVRYRMNQSEMAVRIPL